ncbi:MAG: DNA-directed RNA polymerase subunit K [Candidatus Nanoarchaeia archaeon]
MVKIQIPEDHVTKYEKARLIGARALQISMGAPFMMKLSEDELKKMQYNPVEIAKLEFEKGVLNMSIKRILPHEK